MMTEPQRRVTGTDVVLVRTRKLARVAVTGAVVLLGVFTVAGVLLKNQATGAVFRTSDQVAIIGIGVLLAAGTLMFTRPRVRADEHGIEVRNLLGTQYYPWLTVLSVSFPDGASWARLELPDDEYASVMAVQATDGMHAVRAVRALRGLHRKARGDESPPTQESLGEDEENT